VTAATFALLAGGGTGGHVYPALSLAEELVGRGHPPASIRFVGGRRGPEGRIVPEAGFAIDLLPGRGWQRRFTLANVGVALETIAAFVRAVGLVRRYRPRVVVGFGGYASLPCLVAAWLWRVPRVVHEQDSVIGLANRIGMRLGARVAASLPGVDAPDVVLTGNPIRPVFRDFERRVQDPPLVAAFGGALGARSINHATLGLYDRWRHRRDVAVHHVSGPRNEDDCRRQLQAMHRAGDSLAYELVGYEPRMPDVYTRAALAVCRAGAGTVAELTAAGLPAVLVPLPGAPSDHQARNAATLAAAGAAVVVGDTECDAAHLDRVVNDLLASPARLAEMSEAARALARPDAAARLADLVEQHARPEVRPAGRSA
jgi:UDP-N-acetylglucosamine--N-acetylmuramyl-(pentapeptide) pyrophosphoryl-undecaprenol N-acetylglucosamine transferase